MKQENVLILKREDMTESRKGRSILLIDFTDFKISDKPIIENSSIILFIDNNAPVIAMLVMVFPVPSYISISSAEPRLPMEILSSPPSKMPNNLHTKLNASA